MKIIPFDSELKIMSIYVKKAFDLHKRNNCSFLTEGLFSTQTPGPRLGL